MTTHTNCTHAKTKAGRAACRAGKAQPAAESLGKRQANDAAARLRAKASRSTEGRLSDSREHEGEPLGRATSASAKLYMSGHCAIGNHDTCVGIYALTPCTCTCHEQN